MRSLPFACLCLPILAALAAALRAEEPAASDRWLHPAAVTIPLRLPSVFDQQCVLTLGDGRLLAMPAAGNATIVSGDGGRTWSEPRAMRSGPGVIPTRGPMLRTRDGVLVCLFQVMTGLNERWDEKARDWTPNFRSELWVTRSRDDGLTWDTPTRTVPGNHGTIVTVMQTRSGHIVVPAEVTLNGPGRWGTYSLVSADNGATWSRSNLIDLGGNGHHDGAIEATVAELGDERLLMLIRTGFGRFWEVYSDDHGATWREWRGSSLEAGTAPGYLQRLASGRLVLLYNHVDRTDGPASPRSAPSAAYVAGARGQRAELSLVYSDDDARTWSKPVVVLRHHKGTSAYPFVLERGGGELWIWTRYGSAAPVYFGVRETDLGARLAPGR